MPEKKEKKTVSSEEKKGLEKEIRTISDGIFFPHKKDMNTWARRYGPVAITLIVGLATYVFLGFYLFSPYIKAFGTQIQLFILLMIIFGIASVLIYIGVKTEVFFIRLLSSVFIFVIFSFMILFILLAHSALTGG